MSKCPNCGEEIAERDFPAAPWWGTKCRCYLPVPPPDPNAGLEGHSCPMCGSEGHLSCPGTENWLKEHPLEGRGKDAIHGQR